MKTDSPDSLSSPDGGTHSASSRLHLVGIHELDGQTQTRQVVRYCYDAVFETVSTPGADSISWSGAIKANTLVPPTSLRRSDLDGKSISDFKAMFQVRGIGGNVAEASDSCSTCRGHRIRTGDNTVVEQYFLHAVRTAEGSHSYSSSGWSGPLKTSAQWTSPPKALKWEERNWIIQELDLAMSGNPDKGAIINWVVEELR